MVFVSGFLAQLVERLVYTEDVGGSSPSGPTISILKELSTLRMLSEISLERNFGRGGRVGQRTGLKNRQYRFDPCPRHLCYNGFCKANIAGVA